MDIPVKVGERCVDKVSIVREPTDGGDVRNLGFFFLRSVKDVRETC